MIKYKVTVDNVGTIRWYLDDKLHRLDGPAIEFANGGKHWYLDGKLNRLDGPAIEYADGGKCWYLDGKVLTEKEFNNRHVKQMTVADIEAILGYKVEVIS
jgi:hypothetical protein